ncbi:FAD-dependent oxidoreductase [Paenibacillus thalictri]|uniref:FAD-dependent oxidoreductase n=1 Tax=Paenibacillus thalictri TaxID=2527873 RepID=A0A4V2J398_9BACL|nr:FAD-dependent oxidoreductase [Paenibacillus thalictri]TBL70728.1 FAD-dependent oxidoreductase [Paenibacillus thalictri]
MVYDVIVCGAGPSGTAAAIAAGREGAKVLLIEKYGFAGGMATSALVNPWAGHEFVHPETKQSGSIIGGIFKEIATRLQEAGGYGSALSKSAFDEERLKYIYDTMLQEAGVDIIYHTALTAAVREEGRITAVQTNSKSGPEEYRGNVFIDATGDGDLAYLAGCEWSLGRPSDNLTQAMTVSFRIGNVDKAAMRRDLEARNVQGLKQARLLVEPYFQKAIQEGRLYYPYREWVHFYDYPHPGVLHFNMTRINKVNGLLAKDLTFSEMEGRRQAFLMADWLRKDVPYFKDSYLEKVACQVGVRETRHVKGLYTMTHEDIAEARKFPDGIARSRYFIDIHSPTGSGFDHEVKNGYGAVEKAYGVPEGDYYEIPYRSLVAAGMDNLLVPCRALSASHAAAAAVRVMATMTAIGQAAGVAGARAAAAGMAVGDVDAAWLRGRLGYIDGEPDYGSPWDKAN